MKFLVEDFQDDYQKDLRDCAFAFASEIQTKGKIDKIRDAQTVVSPKVSGKKRSVTFIVNGVRYREGFLEFTIESIFHKWKEVALELTQKYEKALKEEQTLNSKINELKSAKVDYDGSSEFDWAIGWLASHIAKFKFAIPMSAEQKFTDAFPGTEEGIDYALIDDKRKTINGHPMKMGWSCHIPIKGNCPDILRSYGLVSAEGNAITHVETACALINSFDFYFGEYQNPDDIVKHVGNENAFWEGYYSN